jgi:hypothetical protein
VLAGVRLLAERSFERIQSVLLRRSGGVGTDKEGEVVRKFVLSARRRVAVVTMVVGGALVLGLSTAAATGSHVVPLGGKVAGTGYRFWLKWQWQFQFSHKPPYKVCQTVHVNGHRVGYLGVKTIAPGANRATCTEPAGRPLYVIQTSAECSTFKHDHPNFGTSDSQLEKCAKAELKGIHPTYHTTVDGRTVDVTKLETGTKGYPVTNVPGNFVKVSKTTKGRSAAYGPGLLLTGLGKGTHVVKGTTKISEPVVTKWTYDWTIKVK